MKSEIMQAIEDQRIIEFKYHGLDRVVEPHIYGTIRYTGNEVLSCFQFEGQSHSGGIPDWRTFLIREIMEMHISGKNFLNARPGYNPLDPRTIEVFAKVQ